MKDYSHNLNLFDFVHSRLGWLTKQLNNSPAALVEVTFEREFVKRLALFYEVRLCKV